MMQACLQVKTIGTNGQLSLGKEFAGKMVLIEQLENGTWIIKSGKFVPDAEKWLYQDSNMAKIEKALEWTDNNKPSANFNKVILSIENDLNKNRSK